MATLTATLQQASYTDSQSSTASVPQYSKARYVLAATGSSSRVRRTYLKFDLSSIPKGSTITSATLSLYSYDADVNWQASVALVARRVTSSWDQTTITHNSQPSNTSTSQASGTFSGYNTWYAFDATSLIQSIVNNTNYGIVVMASNESTGSKTKAFRCRTGTGTSYATSWHANAPKLTVEYTTPSITVTFYGNGATGTGANTGNTSTNLSDLKQTVTYSSAYTAFDLYNVESLFTRTGYIKVSAAQAWRVGSATSTTYLSDSSANFTSYLAGGTQTLKLYANWRARNYVLTVKYQNGLPDHVTDGSSSKPHLIYGAQNWNYLGVPIRAGYTFTGYYSAPSGGIQIYDTSGYRIMGTSYWDSNGDYCYAGDMTVYAQWTENYITITHNINGGEQDSSMSSTYPLTNEGWVYNYKYDDSYESLYNVEQLGFKRSGYTAKPEAEWIYANSVTIGENDPTLTTGQLIAQKLGKDLTTTSSSATVLVNWSKAPINLTYNANGGIMSNGETIITESKTYGSLITTPTPTRIGHIFKGWYMEFNETNFVNYGKLYKYTNKLNVHLNAYMDDWSEFDGYNRLISCTQSGGWNFESYSNGKITALAYDATAKEYRYAISDIKFTSLSPGWHSFDIIWSGAGTGIELYVDDVYKATSPTITEKIGYNSTNAIFVGAEASTSQLTPESPSSYPYFKGKIANVIISEQAEKYSEDTYNTIVVPAEDITLYAIWEEVPNFIVSFDANGATGSDLTQYNKVFTYNSPSILEVPDPYDLNLFLFGNTPVAHAEWNSESDGSGYSLAALQNKSSSELEELAREKNGNLVFYLNWRPAGKACVFQSNTSKVFAHPWIFNGVTWTKCMVYIYNENNKRWYPTIEPLGGLENYQIVYPDGINIYASSDSDEFYPSI